ncbi:MAG: Flp pilus assembly complex ATPase component TadA [Chloroflexi bacterium]|nr:Flp pilus assembly complex ATPase component TadA [Chloroflexota bacterium]
MQDHRDAESMVNGNSANGNGTMVFPTPEPETTEDSETPEPGIQTRPSLAQMLIEAGVVSWEQVNHAAAEAQQERLPLGQVLVRDGLVLSRDMATVTALHTGLPMVDLKTETIDNDALKRLPQDISRKYLVLPVRENDEHLTVAMTDPTDLRVLQDLAAYTGYIIDPVIATPEDIEEHIDLAYRLAERESTASSQSGNSDVLPMAFGKLAEVHPTQLVDMLVSQAIQDRASDIHIEPEERRLRIRFRIDGALQDVMSLPPETHPAIISRLKIMANMNIAERRRPQDGQFTVDSGSRTIDVRVAICNTVSGEIAVLRLLDNKKFTLLTLDQLGMGGQVLEQHRKLLRLPYGMVIVSGPTGSGKSTSLYASILQIDRVEQKVITIEDPVEYRMPNVDQMQVHNEAGVTFATQLRSILRLDPDVVLVGEIRDKETAVIATQAALTGHLVLTSLHANDSVSALIRLRDLGVPPYLIASSVAGIVSQRMVRVVCKDCQMSVERPIVERQAYAAETGEDRSRFIYGSGCTMCAQTGYRGRTGVFELLPMTDKIKDLFLEEAPRSRIWDQAVQDGIAPISADGMEKVKKGITTPYEVMRISFTL